MLFLSWDGITCCKVYAKDWSPAKWRTSLKTLIILITRTNRITLPALPMILETLNYFQLLTEHKLLSYPRDPQESWSGTQVEWP